MVLFPPPFYFVFDISNLLSYIQNNFSYELARPICAERSKFLVGERAKRARHSQVCSIENRGYIIYILGMCSFQHKWASERQLYLFVLLARSFAFLFPSRELQFSSSFMLKWPMEYEVFLKFFMYQLSGPVCKSTWNGCPAYVDFYLHFTLCD